LENLDQVEKYNMFSLGSPVDVRCPCRSESLSCSTQIIPGSLSQDHFPPPEIGAFSTTGKGWVWISLCRLRSANILYCISIGI